MKEEERYNILKNAKVNVVDGNMQLTENEISNLSKGAPYRYEAFFKLLGEKFGIYQKYMIGNIEFEYSKGTVKESVNKMSNPTVKNEDIVSMMACTKDIIDNAIPIKIHDDRYKGTTREDTTLINIYVMLGAYENNGCINLVEIIAKNRYTSNNKVYMEVVLSPVEKKGNEVIGKPVDIIPSNSSQSFPYEVSLADVIKDVNPEETFLKYIPLKMLTEKQKAYVNVAQKKEKIKLDYLKQGIRINDREINKEYERLYGDNHSEDIHYSYRDDPRSNRELLADALMSAAKTKRERELLEAYKKTIGSLDMLERLKREKTKAMKAAETADES